MYLKNEIFDDKPYSIVYTTKKVNQIYIFSLRPFVRFRRFLFCTNISISIKSYR